MGQATGMRFGLQTIQNRPWATMVASWQRYEALGFDSLWMPDHLVRPFDPSESFFESWTMLAALATLTNRVRLGVLVSSNTFRHPALLAKQAITIDHISGGRLELGIGAGWFALEHQMFGIPLPEPPELVARYREAVMVVDTLLRYDVSSLDGTYYQLKDAPSRPSPVQQPRPPLTLGAHGPKMLAIAARFADRWNTVGSVADVVTRLHVLDTQCDIIGRHPGEILRSLLYVPAQIPDEHPWASSEAFRDFVERYAAIGINEFILQPPDDERLIERIALDVLPQLR